MQITDPCGGATISLDSSLMYNVYYAVYDAQVDPTINIYAVSATGLPTGCPSYAYDILNNDDTVIDSSIFTFDSSSLVFSVYTTDQSTIGTY